MFLLTSFVVLGAYFSSGSDGLEVTFEAEHHTNVTLVCDDTALNLPYTTFKKYWILPNESVLQWSELPNDRYIVGVGPGFNLTVINVDDTDSGWYYCVILWDNYIYLVHSIKVGLNVDNGDLLSKYIQSAIIGGSAAGVAFGILLLACIIHFCLERKRRVKKEKIEKPKKEKPKKTKKEQKHDKTKKKTKKEKKHDKTQKAEREAIYELDKTVEKFEEENDNGGEIAFHVSRSMANRDHMDNNDGTIMMISGDIVHQYYDDKAFQIENDAIVPFDETDIDIMTNCRTEECDTSNHYSVLTDKPNN